METWSAVYSGGWDLFAGYQGTRAQAVEAVLRRVWQDGRGGYVRLVGSVSGAWRVGPRGGVRRERRTRG